MNELALGIVLVTIGSLVMFGPWIAGAVIARRGYRRRRSPGLGLARKALLGLVVLQLLSIIVPMLLFPIVMNLGWSSGAEEAAFSAVSALFQLGCAGLTVLLAMAFFRLLQENHATVAHR